MAWIGSIFELSEGSPWFPGSLALFVVAMNKAIEELSCLWWQIGMDVFLTQILLVAWSTCCCCLAIS